MGAVALARRWREPFWRLIGLGTVLGGIPAALTMDQGHALRAIAVVPFLVIIMALGAADLVRVLSGQRWIVATLAVAVLVEIGGFITDYFTNYASRQASWFDPGFGTALATALRTTHQWPIMLSDHIDQAATMFAFFSQQDPRTYRVNGIAGGGGMVGPVGGDRSPRARWLSPSRTRMCGVLICCRRSPFPAATTAGVTPLSRTSPIRCG